MYLLLDLPLVYNESAEACLWLWLSPGSEVHILGLVLLTSSLWDLPWRIIKLLLQYFQNHSFKPIICLMICINWETIKATTHLHIPNKSYLLHFWGIRALNLVPDTITFPSDEVHSGTSDMRSLCSFLAEVCNKSLFFFIFLEESVGSLTRMVSFIMVSVWH